MLSLRPCWGCPTIECNMDERCTSMIESSCGHAKKSSSPSYGNELELIYIHITRTRTQKSQSIIDVNVEGKKERKEKSRTHCPKKSSNPSRFFGCKVHVSALSACSFRSSLRVRLPERSPRCEWDGSASGVGGVSGSSSVAPPRGGNTT